MKTSWKASAAMFSGRRDPVWAVKSADVKKLMSLWGRLEAFQGVKPVIPALGYRGCFLESPKGERWEVFGGVVWSGAESRADPEEAFEKAVLKTAPPGVRTSRDPLTGVRGSGRASPNNER